MAKNSNIEWTHHTFNPWRGCAKVSQGCTNCYAETLSARNPEILGVWGPQGTRVIASESMWKEPVKWNKAAEAMGERHRVFCASLADVFEGTDTMPAELELTICAARLRLFELIRTTPNLDWLLLTKRPENIVFLVGRAYYDADESGNIELRDMLWDWGHGKPPENVWLGTSIEDQKAADKRIPHLLAYPAKVRFLSCEPLLGPLDLTKYIWTCRCPLCEWTGFGGDLRENREENMECPNCGSDEVGNRFDFMQAGMFEPSESEWRMEHYKHSPIDWIIAGGESGANARVMHPDWVRSLRDQCQAASVPFLFKQWGEWREPLEGEAYDTSRGRAATPPAFIVAQQGTVHCFKFDDIENGKVMIRVGKKKAGRLLDGREWNESPDEEVCNAA